MANKPASKLEPSEQQPLVRQRNLFAGIATGNDSDNRNQAQKSATSNGKSGDSHTTEPTNRGAQSLTKLPQRHEQPQDAYHHVTDDENENESPGDGEEEKEVDENVNVNAREQSKGSALATAKKQHQQPTTSLGGTTNLARIAMSRGGRNRPFSTRSNRHGAKGPAPVPVPKVPQQVQQQEQPNPNKDLVSKSLVLATQGLGQETKPVHRNNRSLFAQQRRTTPKGDDNATVASMSSEKGSTVTITTTTSKSKGISGNASVASVVSSVAPSLSTVTNDSNSVYINTGCEKTNVTPAAPLSTTSSKASSSTAYSHHHARANSKNGLREKLLGGAAGTASSTEQSKPSNVPTSPSNKIAKVKPDPVPIAPSTTTSSSGFDEKDYVRSLLAKQSKSNKRTSTSSTTSSKPKSSSMAGYVDRLLHKHSGGRDENQTGSSEALSSKPLNLSTTVAVKSDTSSSTFSDLVAHKLLSKAKKRLSPKGKGANSPRSDGSRSRLEDAAKTLAGNMLSGYSKSHSPKNGRPGFKLGVPTRSQTRFPKKGAQSRSTANYEHNLAKSSSIDSIEPVKEASSFQSISYSTSISSTDADDDKTRTTLASSSNLSDDTKRSHGSSLKQLSTAETMDTDTSSTIMGNLHSASSDSMQYSAIMGNLHSASSDSMQYSSEEGCEEISVMHKHAMKAIDKVPSGAVVAYDKTRATRPGAIPVELQTTSKRHQAENIGYNKFMKALQLEASLAHSQVRFRFFFHVFFVM